MSATRDLESAAAIADGAKEQQYGHRLITSASMPNSPSNEANAGRTTGGKDGKGGEINETVRSVHSLVTNVDKRTAEIATGVNRMTSAGTKQIDVMSASFQRTLSTADRVLNNLDKNPSRLIWGGSSPSAAAPKRQ